MENNIKLRSQILEFALLLELTVSSIIKVYFFMDKVKLKTISNKSGRLSFKNQIDLLNDFGVIDDSEYDSLLKLMEIRNQFMHNMDCNSFTKAVEILGTDRGKFLLKFVDSEYRTRDIETQYSQGYQNCFKISQNLLIKKFEQKREDISFKADFHKNYNQKIVKLINKHFRIVKKIMTDTTVLLVNHKVDKTVISEFHELYEKTITKAKFGKFPKDRFELNDELIKKMLS